MKGFVRNLMRRMTLDEKIGQLNLVNPGGGAVTGVGVNGDIEQKLRNGLIGGVFGNGSVAFLRPLQELAVRESRLGIPLLFGYDVIHGYKTIFPIPLGLSSTWDMALIEKTARIAAAEASAAGIKWTFSPMVDIARDPRWGRVAEGSGEDPYLGARIAEAMVRGYQGSDLAAVDSVFSCLKHFVGYGAVESGRDYNRVDMSDLELHSVYLPPFRAGVKAGAGSVMAAFNCINGIPATAHGALINGTLRGSFNFKGMVVTDYTAINEMIEHGLGDLQTVSALALKAGIDMDMVGEGFLTTLKNSLDDGRIAMRDIDAACRRILESKYRLGLFGDPFKYLDADRERTAMLKPEYRKIARDAAARSCVLLKNTNHVLPLSKFGTIGLIGPLAHDQRNMQGTWAIAANSNDSITLLRGMRDLAGAGAQVLYARGANLSDDPVEVARVNVFEGDAGNTRFTSAYVDPRGPDALLTEALAVAERSDVIVAVLGEAKEHSGESSSRTNLDLPASQKKLLRALSALGKPLVLVTMSGRPLTLEWEYNNVDAMLHTWFGGTEAGNGIADVLFGHHNPSGKLTMSFPRNVGQVPVYMGQRKTGRPSASGDFEKFKSTYLDCPNTPLFPFGFGLSYTQFRYGPVCVSKKTLNGRDDLLLATATVTNTGQHRGDEIAQLYITDPVASITRPVMELKGFQKLSLQPGQVGQAIFEIRTEDLKFFNSKLQSVWEPGDIVIHIGADSAHLQSARVAWNNDHLPKPALRRG